MTSSGVFPGINTRWKGVSAVAMVRRIDWVLVLILALAVAVRAWGAGFGLPHTEAVPDESYVVNMAIKFGTGNLNPGSFLYPTFFMYILFGVFGGYFVVGRLLGRYGSVGEFEQEFIVNPQNFYLLGRLLNVFFAMLTVLVVYLIARRISGRPAARLSALLLSLAYLHVRDSHFAKTDILMTLLLCLSLLFILRSYDNKQMRDYFLAGAFAGLAMSTKWMGILMPLPMFIAHALNVREEGQPLRRMMLDKRLLIFGAVLVVFFFVGTPFALLDLPTLSANLFTPVTNAGAAGHTKYVDIGWLYHLRVNLPIGMGWTLFLGSLAGSVLMLIKQPRQAMILLAFPVFYFLIIGSAQAVFSRYMVPLVPMLVVPAAYFILSVVDWLDQRVKSRLIAPFALAVLIIAMLAPSVISLVRWNELASRTDNRQVATEWMNQNVQPNATIYQAGDRSSNLKLNPSVEDLQRELAALTKSGSTDAIRKRTLQASIDYQSRFHIPGFREWQYDITQQIFTGDGAEPGDLPQYIITFDDPMKIYNLPKPHITELLRTAYRQINAFEVVDVNDPANTYDRQDAMYVPYGGFNNVTRTGPNIYVYQLAQP